MRASEFLRAEKRFRPQGDQGPSAQPAERLPHRRLGRQRFQRSKKGCSSALVQRAALAFLQRVLIGQKRRALHEEHSQCRYAEIGDRNVAASPLARVGKSRADARQAERRDGKSCIPALTQTFADSRFRKRQFLTFGIVEIAPVQSQRR